MTPHEKQVMMFSATLSKEIRPVCRKFMQDVNTFSLLSLHSRPLPPPLRARSLQTPCPSSTKKGTSPSGSDDSLKRPQRQRQLALGSARVPGTFRKTWSG